MDPFFHLVEERLRSASRAGVFDDLPGMGRPLELPDLDAVTPELRASYILLQSNGFVPPELEARKAWLRLEDLIAACTDPRERRELAEHGRHAWLRYRLLAEQRGGGRAWIDYRDALLDRFAGETGRDADAALGAASTRISAC